MGFKSLSPPAKAAAADPTSVRVSAGRRGKGEDSPIVVNVAIGAALFEEFGSPDKVSVALGEGGDHGKLQLVAMHPDNKAVGFPVTVFERSGTAVVRVAVPGIKREAKKTAIDHDLDEDHLTFIIPVEFFRPPPAPAAHDARAAIASGGGVTPSALH